MIGAITDLVILNNAVDLELLDTVTDGNELGSTPQQTVQLNALDGGSQSVHIGLIIPGLDIERDGGLSDGLGLVGLLGSVLSKTLSLELLGGIIDLLVIRTEKIDIIIFLLGSSSRSSSRPVKRAWLGFKTDTRLKTTRTWTYLLTEAYHLATWANSPAGAAPRALATAASASEAAALGKIVG